MNKPPHLPDAPLAERAPESGPEASGVRPTDGPWLRRAAPWLLVAAAFAAYGNTFDAPFVFDDVSAIVQNTHLRSLTPLSRCLDAPPGTGASGRPLVALTLALNHAVHGLDVSGYRITNVAIHALCALALLGLLRRVLAQGTRVPCAGGLAFGIALVWTLHPLATDAVDLVITRNEQLMALFYLGTLTCAWRALDPATGPGAPRRWRVLAVLLCALGMASKENMVSAPLAVLLLERWRTGGSLVAPLRGRPLFYASLSATWILLAFLVLHADRGETVATDGPLGPVAYFLIQAEVLPTYLRLCAWPRPLILDYGDWFTFQGDRSWFPFGVATLLAAGTAVVLTLRRNSLGLPSLLVFAVLAPTSSVLPVTGEIAAEHRMYLPLAGVLTVAGAALHGLLRPLLARRSFRILWGSVAMLLALACGAETWSRNRDYATAESIWRDTLAKRPYNARAYCGLAVELIRLGRQTEAVEQLERSLRVRPSSAESHRLLGLLAARAGREQAADEHYRAAARHLPNLPDHVLASSLAARDAGDPAFAAAGLDEVLRMRPGERRARRALGWILAASPDAELRDGSRALELARGLCEASRNAQHLDLLAAALAETGRFERAVQVLDEALDQADDGTPAGAAGRAAPGSRAALLRRRALYVDRRPYRGP